MGEELSDFPTSQGNPTHASERTSPEPNRASVQDVFSILRGGFPASAEEPGPTPVDSTLCARPLARPSTEARRSRDCPRISRAFSPLHRTFLQTEGYREPEQRARVEHELFFFSRPRLWEEYS